MFFDATAVSEAALNKELLAGLEAAGKITSGDTVLLTRGQTLGVHGGTNSMQIIQVP